MERADHLYAGLQPVECAKCEVQVLVRKHSPHHTNVQWTAGAVEACPFFHGRQSALVPTCVNLRDSIEQAVRDGLIEVMHD
jgi:hypothetical protein